MLISDPIDGSDPQTYDWMVPRLESACRKLDYIMCSNWGEFVMLSFFVARVSGLGCEVASCVAGPSQPLGSVCCWRCCSVSQRGWLIGRDCQELLLCCFRQSRRPPLLLLTQPDSLTRQTLGPVWLPPEVLGRLVCSSLHVSVKPVLLFLTCLLLLSHG